MYARLKQKCLKNKKIKSCTRFFFHQYVEACRGNLFRNKSLHAMFGKFSRSKMRKSCGFNLKKIYYFDEQKSFIYYESVSMDRNHKKVISLRVFPAAVHKAAAFFPLC